MTIAFDGGITEKCRPANRRSGQRPSPRLKNTDVFVMRADGTGRQRVPLPFRDVTERPRDRLPR
jgi:hypothetical protein